MKTEEIIKECVFKAVRSSGAGGQHVNKVSSKVVLSFNITTSESLREDEKELLLTKLKSRLNKENTLQLDSSESRSQYQNKDIVTNRFISIIQGALFVPKSRRPTRPTRGSILRKKNNKTHLSQKKSLRRKPSSDS